MKQPVASPRNLPLLLSQPRADSAGTLRECLEATSTIESVRVAFILF